MEDRCKYRFCGIVLWQNGRGRKREYCDDTCRQAEHRARQADAAKLAAVQEVASWGAFLPATVEHLSGYITAGSRDTARKLADLILAEQQANKQLTVSAEQVRELYQVSIRAAETEKAAALARVKDLERQVEQLCAQGAKHEAALAVQAETVIRRGADLRKQAKVIADLESRLEQERRGSEQVQESFRQYVALTNERVSMLAGELAHYRQEKERQSKQHKQS